MKIAIIGGGWAGIYSAYKIKKQFGLKHQIFIFEKENDIAGKCKNLLGGYPGGACQFPNYKNFTKVLNDLNIKTIERYVFPEDSSVLVLINVIFKTMFYKIFSCFYENQVLESLYSKKEIDLCINLFVKNYGYKEMTFHYFSIYLRDFVNIKTAIQIMNAYFFKKNLPHFLSDNIYEVMKKMINDINIVCNSKITKIEKINKKYKLFSEKNTFDDFDVLIFTIPIGESFSNIVEKEIIDECKKLVYTTYCSTALQKQELEDLKNDILFFVKEIDKNKQEYSYTYLYNKEAIKDIPENRKNIIENYFPRFKNPKESKKIIEKFQGKDNIFYTGGYLSFELIESICVHINKMIQIFNKQR